MKGQKVVSLIVSLVLFLLLILTTFSAQPTATAYAAPLFSDDFSNSSWDENEVGSWVITADGEYKQTKSEDLFGATSTAGQLNWTDYTYEVELNITGGHHDTAIMFRMQDPRNYYVLAIRSTSWGYANKLELYKSTDGVWSSKATPASQPTIADNTPYRYKVVLSGSQIGIYFNNESTAQITYTDATAPILNGKIGLRTWQSTATFDDVVVSSGSTQLFADDFSNEEWSLSGGSWSTSKRNFTQSSTSSGVAATALAGSTAWTDYVYSVEVSPTGGDRDTALMFRVQNDTRDFYVLAIRSATWTTNTSSANRLELYKSVDNVWTSLATAAPTIEDGKYYRYKVAVSGNYIAVYFDNATTPTFAVSDTTSPYTSGKIGLRTWQSSADFTQLSVAPHDTIPLMVDSFGTGAGNWTPASGTWSVTSGEYRQTSTTTGVGANTFAGLSTWADYTYEADVALTGSGWDGALLFRVKDANNFYALAIRSAGWPYGSNRLELFKATAGSWTSLYTASPTIANNASNHYKIVLAGSLIKVYFNGEVTPRITYDDTAAPFTTGYVGLRTYGSTALFDNVAVSSSAKFGTQLVDDFSGSLAEWTSSAGSWAASSGEYTQSSTTSGVGANSLAGQISWTDYAYELDARITGGGYDTAALFRVQDANNLYALAIRSAGWAYGANKLELYKVVNGTWTSLATAQPTINNGTSYHYRIALTGNMIRVYFNNEAAARINYTDPSIPYKNGKIGLRTYGSSASFDNVVVRNGSWLLHYIDPEHRLSDLHPFYKDGAQYLFHLYPDDSPVSSAVRNCPGYDGADNGLVTATDLLHWNSIDINHRTNWWAVGVFSDTVSNKYRSYFDQGDKSAVSSDLINWSAAATPLAIPTGTIFKTQDYPSCPGVTPGTFTQRDPWTFYNSTDNKWWTLMTCRVNDANNQYSNGAVCYATSPDMTNWTHQGNLYYPQNISEPEVPQMFKIGSKWYLLFSAYDEGEAGKDWTRRVGGSSYRVADNPTGPWSVVGSGLLDGSDLSAANVAYDGAYWTMMGWIPLTDAQTAGYWTWGGHVALPREVYQVASSTELGTRLHPQISNKIRGGQLSTGITSSVGSWSLSGETRFTGGTGSYGRAVLSGAYDRLDIDLTLTPSSNNKRMGLLLNYGASATPAGIEVAVDKQNSKLIIAANGKVYGELPITLTGGNYTMRVIVEEDMIELFVNNRYSLTARIGTKLAGTSVQLFAQDGDATFSNLGVYRLNELNQIP